jgi:mevalonate kinase
MIQFSANGKLLLTGEYLILNGATSLVLPLKFGQSLSVEQLAETKNQIYWESFQTGTRWFFATLNTSDFCILETSNRPLARQLQKIFRSIQQINPVVFEKKNSLSFRTNLEFDRNWGWGSSSTLFSNLARWACIDPYVLFRNLEKGSGYDIAAAVNSRPFLYKLQQGKPVVKLIDFNPPFAGELFFVYLGNKQKSSGEVNQYMKSELPDTKKIKRISELSYEIARCRELKVFENLLSEHEKIISGHLNKPTVRGSRFVDFDGTVKSLGAWGGDFILMTCIRGRAYVENYLASKGLNTVFTFNELKTDN